MSLQNPSQFQVDNLHSGDIIHIKSRSGLYKLVRNLFFRNKQKLSIYNKATGQTEMVYQEDCVIIYESDIASYVQLLNVDCMYTNDFLFKLFIPTKLDQVYVNDSSFCIKTKYGSHFVIPLDTINKLFNTRDIQIKNSQNSREIYNNIHYGIYNEEFFKNQVNKKHIKSWNYTFCNTCGKPVKMTFLKDKILISTTCVCGCVNIKIKELTYTQFCDWFNSETDKNIKNYYKQFWN